MLVQIIFFHQQHRFRYSYFINIYVFNINYFESFINIAIAGISTLLSNFNSKIVRVELLRENGLNPLTLFMKTFHQIR